MAIWLPLILAAIQMIVQWLSNRNKLTPQQQKKLNDVIYRFNTGVRDKAVTMGCVLDGKEDTTVTAQFAPEDD